MKRNLEYKNEIGVEICKKNISVPKLFFLGIIFLCEKKGFCAVSKKNKNSLIYILLYVHFAK